MKAAWYERLGPARDVLTVGQMATPIVGVGEVLVRIHASAVNPSDVKQRSGWGGLKMRALRVVPHNDGAGVIEAVGMHFTNPSLKSLLSYGIFIAVLLFRPQGLFGARA